MAENFGLQYSQLLFRRRQFEVGLLQSLKKLADGRHVTVGVRDGSNSIVQICGHMLSSFDRCADDLHEPSRRSIAFLGHNNPLIQLGRRAKGGHRCGVFLRSDLMKRQDQVEKRPDFTSSTQRC